MLQNTKGEVREAKRLFGLDVADEDEDDEDEEEEEIGSLDVSLSSLQDILIENSKIVSSLGQLRTQANAHLISAFLNTTPVAVDMKK